MLFAERKQKCNYFLSLPDFVTVLQSTELDGATNVSSGLSRDWSPNFTKKQKIYSRD